jgi:hypothetical protein
MKRFINPLDNTQCLHFTQACGLGTVPTQT